MPSSDDLERDEAFDDEVDLDQDPFEAVCALEDELGVPLALLVIYERAGAL